jgi:hypothetical protein
MKQTEKQKEWKQNHYLENKDLYSSKQSLRRQQIKEYIESQKTLCCVCNENDVACLDFHHLDGDEKYDKLSNAIKDKWGKEKIDLEISKCVVLCSNCHRKLHYYNMTIDELKNN